VRCAPSWKIFLARLALPFKASIISDIKLALFAPASWALMMSSCEGGREEGKEGRGGAASINVFLGLGERDCRVVCSDLACLVDYLRDGFVDWRGMEEVVVGEQRHA